MSKAISGKRKAFFALCSLLFPLCAPATTWQSDGSRDNTQFIHDIQAVDGDTITLPDGTFTWTTKVTISKAIHLKGEGIGRTIVKDGVQSGPFLQINESSNGVFEMSAIEFQNGGRVVVAMANNPPFRVTGNNLNPGASRVHHCKFDHIRGQLVWDNAIGSVVDHNEFLFIGNGYCCAMADGYDGGTHGDKSWTSTTGFGGPNFTFFEDNIFDHSDGNFYAMMDAFAGARYCVRRNLFKNCHTGGHGTEGQRDRGIRAAEIYQNEIVNNDGGVMHNARGGMLLYWGNTATGPSSHGIVLHCHRIFTAGFWGLADGTNPADKNENGAPVQCIDQVGVSGGGLITGGADPVFPPGWNDQTPELCYIWSNTFNGQPAPVEVPQSIVIRRDVNYKTEPKPGYTPYTYPHPLVIGGPAPSPTPQPSPSPTATQSPTTPTPTPTPTPTETPTSTPTPAPTETPTPSPEPSSTPTSTPAATATPQTIPNAPSNLTAVSQQENVFVTWQDNSDNEDGFYVERSDNYAPYHRIATVPANTPNHLDTDVVRNRRYTYRVQAFNQAGASAYSNYFTVRAGH